MLNAVRDMSRVRRWQRLRHRILGAASPAETLGLLSRFGGGIRQMAPKLAGKMSTIVPEDFDKAEEVASAHGVILGAWLQLDPANPEWPGRDRLFVIRREDLLNSCSLLSTLGFFPMELVPAMVENVDHEGRKAVVPGLEYPGYPAEEIPGLLWESAIESARSKRAWRELVGTDAAWAEAEWRKSPAVWRSVAIVDVADAVTEQCRVLPMRQQTEKPAGLVVLVKVGQTEAPELAGSWEAAGWQTAVVNREDSLVLYNVLSGADMASPFAVMLATDSTSRPHISRTALRRREAGLLGEMSDADFNDLMGEFLGV